jgi:hypothetical protein
MESLMHVHDRLNSTEPIDSNAYLYCDTPELPFAFVFRRTPRVDLVFVCHRLSGM